MQKLISKNPILRFKLGKLILKFQLGGKSSNEKWADFWGNLFNGWNWRSGVLKTNRLQPKLKILIQPQTTNPKDYSFMTKGTLNSESELSKKQREDYFNKLKLKYDFVSIPFKKLNIISTNNVWLKGYKHNEVKDVRAMLNLLIKLGLLNDKFGADGKWGDNTEAAYLKYLLLLNIPTYEKPEMPSVAEMAEIYSEENKPLYQRIRFKQGGRLIPRNPVKRFKLKK